MTEQSRAVRRVLLPISHPDEAAALADLAAALVAPHQGEVVILQCVNAAAEPSPAVVLALNQIRAAGVAADHLSRPGKLGGALIRQTAMKIHADLILWGAPDIESWAESRRKGLLDSVLESPPCDVLAAVGWQSSGAPMGLSRFLVPVSGGPNAGRALEIALDLAESANGSVTALLVCRDQSGAEQNIQEHEARLRGLLGPWCDHPRLQPLVLPATSPVQGIMKVAGQDHDLVWLGASQAAVIDSELFGEVPRRVAEESRTPVVVVKRRARLSSRLVRWAWWRLFGILPTLSPDDRREIQRDVYRLARSRPDFFVMLVLSAAIASLGLLQNSPAVIIGAMLVAPLMSAIMGLGLGVVLGGAELVRRAAKTALRGTGLAVGVALVIGLLYPDMGPTEEILGRVRPGVLDLLVALASGAAGAYAICRRDVSTSLAGVAVAVALVPPLAVVGLALSMARWDLALGAVLLFATNLIAIASAGGLVFLLLGFAPPSGQAARWAILRRGVASELTLLAAIALLLLVLTVQDRSLVTERRAVYGAVLAQVQDMPEVSLRESDIEIVRGAGGVLELQITVRSPRQFTYDAVLDLQRAVATRLQREVSLKLVVIPTTELDPLLPPTHTPTATNTITPSPGPTSTPSPTVTASPTATPTAEASVTPSMTATQTPDPTATETASATPTVTATPTATATPTPMAGVVQGTEYAGLMVRQAPAGKVIGGLYEGQSLTIYHLRQVADGWEWAWVSTQDGLAGWVAARFVAVR
jgi:uncharacterized hydrophobic protein (TIGR00271 family)